MTKPDKRALGFPQALIASSGRSSGTASAATR